MQIVSIAIKHAGNLNRFINLNLLRRLNITKASLLQGFALWESVQPSASTSDSQPPPKSSGMGPTGLSEAGALAPVLELRTHALRTPPVESRSHPFASTISARFWSLRDSNP